MVTPTPDALTALATLTGPHGEALLAAAALTFARTAGLCALAPVIGESDVPRGLRFGFAAVVAAALAPLRLPTAEAALAADSLAAALAPALAWELLLGLGIAAAARFTLDAVGVAGQLIGVSLGLGFAEQYDPRRGEAASIVAVLARALAALAFVSLGGFAAIVRAAATAPLAAADPAAAAALAEPIAVLALRLATVAATLGLGLAAPLLLAALLGNLVIAIAHRAAAAINLFAVGLAAGLLAAGLALLATAPHFAAAVERLADRAVAVLAEGLAP